MIDNDRSMDKSLNNIAKHGWHGQPPKRLVGAGGVRMNDGPPDGSPNFRRVTPPKVLTSLFSSKLDASIPS